MNTLWIVCPVYFDVESFSILRTEITTELRRAEFAMPGRTVFVLVDDSGQQDPDISRVRALDDVIVLPTPFNLGHQRAIVYGLRGLAADVAPEDWIATMDADGEDRPSDLLRLLRALAELPAGSNEVVLARRTGRRETLSFKLQYLLFRMVFRVLTGTVIRTGNFAAFRGNVARQLLFHPYFELCYSSTFLSLNAKISFVPCARATRYRGGSKMGTSRLIMHGLRMLMPFTDRIAMRALIGFGAVFAFGLIAAMATLAIALFTRWPIPTWATATVLVVALVSFVALPQFVVLFAMFAQSGGLSLRGVQAEKLNAANRVLRQIHPDVTAR